MVWSLACLLSLGVIAKLLLVDYQALRDITWASDLSRRLSLAWYAVRTKADDVNVITFAKLLESIAFYLEHRNATIDATFFSSVLHVDNQDVVFQFGFA